MHILFDSVCVCVRDRQEQIFELEIETFNPQFVTLRLRVYQAKKLISIARLETEIDKGFSNDDIIQVNLEITRLKKDFCNLRGQYMRLKLKQKLKKINF